MTKIALFHPAFVTPGGAEILCAQEARFLRDHGDEVEVVTLGYDPARWADQLEGIPVRVTPKRHWTDPFFGFTRMAKLRTRGRRAARSLGGFEVVVAHNFPCNAMLGSVDMDARRVWQCNEPPRGLHVRLANPRLSGWVEGGNPGDEASSATWRKTLRVHDDALAKGGSQAIRARYDIEQTAKLDHIFAISQFSRDNARAIYGRCGEEVVYPIVQFPDQARNRRGIDRSGLRILVHSRLEILKNIDTVIRGFASFHQAHPDSRMHIVGDGAARADLEVLALQGLPAGAVTFHGYLPSAELSQVYDQCDVFALLTLDEPFGMVYPEAAARGLLLIGPDHGGPLEILEGGKLGWCVDPFSPAALVEALEQVWALTDEEADRRRVMADEACRARFSEPVVGPQLRRVILEGRD